MNTVHQAIQFLSAIDDDWALLIHKTGVCNLEALSQQQPYEALVRAVAYQQLSTKAGNAILAKLSVLFGGFPTPEKLASAPFDDLRAVGFSGRKIETIQAIATGARTGLVPTRQEANAMSDEALIERLVVIKGIGQWTVEMLLIFTLGRIDVLPADDLGIVEGYKRLKKLTTAPTRKEMQKIAQAWHPYRSIASWYLWRVPKD
ncbi:MAG: DNA-3-methyladenine glycosylase 2 family protein [Methylotenera sp.]|nr:DNA-3-methyladenine glycosylase 2 family protein [Methylotenera sp.]